MVNITLEMVDEVINRTGSSYKEAKEALEFCEGDVLDAIVYIETVKSGGEKKSEVRDQGAEVVEKLKELVRKGNVNRIVFEKDGKIILDLPVLAGAVGALIFAGPVVVAIVAAVATGCVIKVEKEDGEMINFNDLTEEKFNAVKEKVQDFTKTKDNVVDEENFSDEDHEEEDVIVEAKFMETEEEKKEEDKNE